MWLIAHKNNLDQGLIQNIKATSDINKKGYFLQKEARKN